MKPLRTVLVASLVAAGAGCSNLRQGMAFRPAAERAAAAPVIAAAEPAVAGRAPADPFRSEAESPVARLSRFFPGLSRVEKAQAPATEAMRRPGAEAGARDRRLEAVPRPEPTRDGEAATAALPRRRSLLAPRHADLAARGGKPAEPRREPVAEASAPLPLLSAAVVAEADPGEPDPIAAAAVPESAADDELTAAPRTRRAIKAVVVEPANAPAAPAGRERRVVVADPSKAGTYGMSVRRMPTESRFAPFDEPPAGPGAIASRDPAKLPKPQPVARDEDSEAKRAKVDVVEAPAEPAAPATTAAPAATPERNLDPPQEEAEPAPEPVEPARVEEAEPAPEPVEPARVVASEPERQQEKKQEQTQEAPPADGPPPIVAPADPEPSPEPIVAPADPKPNPVPIAAGRPRAPRGPVAGVVQRLTGRARMEQYIAARDSLPPDLPPVSFPRTYYEGTAEKRSATAANAAKRDDQARTARWTWNPRFLRKLKGENPVPPPPPRSAQP